MADPLPDIAPSYGSSGTTDFRVLEAPFGDGYSQRAADGLNSQRIFWSLTWENREDADVTTLYNFLADKLGYIAFLWTAPDESIERKWIARSMERTPIAAGYSTLQTEFEEVFDL
jgi:phage-related protein